jgi:hypothetical protein
MAWTRHQPGTRHHRTRSKYTVPPSKAVNNIKTCKSNVRHSGTKASSNKCNTSKTIAGVSPPKHLRGGKAENPHFHLAGRSPGDTIAAKPSKPAVARPSRSAIPGSSRVDDSALNSTHRKGGRAPRKRQLLWHALSYTLTSMT